MSPVPSQSPNCTNVSTKSRRKRQLNSKKLRKRLNRKNWRSAPLPLKSISKDPNSSDSRGVRDPWNTRLSSRKRLLLWTPMIHRQGRYKRRKRLCPKLLKKKETRKMDRINKHSADSTKRGSWERKTRLSTSRPWWRKRRRRTLLSLTGIRLRKQTQSWWRRGLRRELTNIFKTSTRGARNREILWLRAARALKRIPYKIRNQVSLSCLNRYLATRTSPSRAVGVCCNKQCKARVRTSTASRAPTTPLRPSDRTPKISKIRNLKSLMRKRRNVVRSSIREMKSYSRRRNKNWKINSKK